MLPFKEFDFQIFPLNMFWYIFSSDNVKFIITFPLSSSFVKKKYIYIYIYIYIYNLFNVMTSHPV